MLSDDALVSCLPGLYRYALRLAKDVEGAKDLVQDTYLAALEYADTYKPSSAAPRTWLGWIMRNSFLSLIRKANTDKRCANTIPIHLLREYLLPNYGPNQEIRVMALEVVRDFKKLAKSQQDAALREFGLEPKTRRDPTAARTQLVKRANLRTSVIAPHVKAARLSGCRNMLEIGAWLTAHDIKTPRGNLKWSSGQVKRIIGKEQGGL